MEAQAAVEDLKAHLGEAFIFQRGSGKDCVVAVRQSGARPALERLKGPLGFNMLVDLTCVDQSALPAGFGVGGPSGPSRFKLVYRLMRLDLQRGWVDARLALEVPVEDGKGPLSSRDLWPAADWLEREVWDMFGVPFSDRPDIKRILLYEEFQGHPLRKDYPIDKRQPLIGPKESAPRDRMTEGDLRPRIA